MTIQSQLQRLVGVPGMEAQAAANLWAGTSGRELQGALNAKAGTVGQEINQACRTLAGLYGGRTDLDGPGALASIPGVGYGGDGMDGSTGRYWSATTANLTTADNKIVRFECAVNLTDYTGSAVQTIGAFTSGELRFDVLTSGLLLFRVPNAAGAQVSAQSSTATAVTDGTFTFLAGQYNPGTGVTSYFKSSDSPLTPWGSITWTQIGTNVGSTTTANYRSNTSAAIGARTSSATPMTGKLYRTRLVYDFGAAGETALWNVNFDRERHTDTVIVDDAGVTWTAAGTGVQVVRA